MIFKFQQGGSAIPPLVSYEPIMVTDDGTSEIDTTRESPKESSDLTDKDLLKMLKDLDGLPNDMQVLTETLQNFYIDQQYSPFPNTVNIASRYLQALFLMRTANFNRKQYDNAFNIVSNNGGINELAINERGQLVCVNSDGDYIKTINNAIELVKHLMKKHNIPISNVVQHNKWSGKNCPQLIRSSHKGFSWLHFIYQCERPIKRLPPSNEAVDVSIDDLARRTIRGEFGNGEQRKKNLGSKYLQVQKRVNEMLNK